MNRQLQILLIEDNESDVILLQRTLEKSELLAQYLVVKNALGMQAALQQKEWDLVISDYRLPDFDGEAALGIAKAFDSELPFILVSATVGEEIAIKMMKAGVNDYLMKDNLVRLGVVVKKELAEAKIRKERKMLDNALNQISTAVINTDLNNFLQTIVIQLSSSLKADHAFIALNINDDKEALEVIAHAKNGCIANNFIYRLEGTPCENAFESNGCIYVENIAELFPKITLLKQMQIAGYIGIPLINSHGSSMGILVLLYKAPVKYPEVKQTILRFYSPRIATEIERSNTQKALKESEEFFSAIFKNSRIGIALVAFPDGIIKDINDTFYQQLGYKKEELVGKTTTAVGLYKNSTDRDRIYKIINEKGVVENEQIEFVTKTGLVFQGLLSIAIINVNGKAFKLFATVDITAEILAKNALRLSEEKYRNIIANINLGLLEVDRNEIIQVANHSFCKMSGYSMEEIIGKSAKALFAKIESNFKINEINSERERGISSVYERLIINKKGEAKHWLISGAPNYNDGGELVGSLGIHMDITEQKLAEKALKLNEEKFKSMVHNISDIITLIDNCGNIIYQSASIKQVLGYEETETIGRNLFEFVHPDDIAMVAFEMEKALLTPGNSNLIEYRFLNSNGEYVMLEGQGNNQLLNPAIKALIVNSKDITVRKNAEAMLIQQAHDLSVSNKELEQFAYLASHDLQEPLRMVSSFMNLLEKKYKDALDGTAINYIRYAVDGANRMKQLINDILLYSRLEGKHQQTQPVNLQTVVEEVKTILQHEILANDVTIFTDDLPVVMAVKLDMEQLLQNLVGNAIKYQPAGNKPIIHITNTERTNDWLIKVKDNGIGIDEKFSDKVFIMFQRLHNKNEYSGTGIGLAICKKIVERNGGNISIESKKGEGSTFIFTIPKPA